MQTDISIADIVVHLHPEASTASKARIEESLRAREGVVSVHFDEEDHPHALIVAYNPEAVSSEALLAEIRKFDSKAAMVSL